MEIDVHITATNTVAMGSGKPKCDRTHDLSAAFSTETLKRFSSKNPEMIPVRKSKCKCGNCFGSMTWINTAKEIQAPEFHASPGRILVAVITDAYPLSRVPL